MKNIKINFAKNTIEISAAFEKKASIYGSDAYRELMNAKHDFPEFTVEVVKPAKAKGSRIRLTYDFMERHISKKSGKDSDQMKTFNILRGKVENEDGIAERASIGEIKLWFLNEYPEIENARKEIDKIIAKAKADREAKKNSKESAKPEELENDKDTDEE